MRLAFFGENRAFELITTEATRPGVGVKERVTDNCFTEQKENSRMVFCLIFCCVAQTRLVPI